jgi:hypothetical protein
MNNDDNSNAQSWEHEVLCKNKKYLDAVVGAILKYGMLNFEVDVIEFKPYHDDTFDGRYTVLIWGFWFNNLNKLTNDLKKIEEKLG